MPGKCFLRNNARIAKANPLFFRRKQIKMMQESSSADRLLKERQRTKMITKWIGNPLFRAPAVLFARRLPGVHVPVLGHQQGKWISLVPG